MAEIYRYFGRYWKHVLDFSDSALIEHFNHISYGTPISNKNGFLHGEKWMDVNVAMWMEDRRKGELNINELYTDDHLPHWWLDKVFK